jgi:hypothetical protein
MSNVRPHMHDDSPPLQVRLGAAFLSFLVGVVLGISVAVSFAAAGVFQSIPFEVWALGMPVALGVFSYFVPSFALALFPAVAHALTGAAKQVTRQVGDPSGYELPDPEPSAPNYLRVAFYLGAAAVVVVLLLGRH